MTSVKWVMVCAAMQTLALLMFAVLTWLGYGYLTALAPGLVVILLSGIAFQKAAVCAEAENALGAQRADAQPN